MTSLNQNLETTTQNPKDADTHHHDEPGHVHGPGCAHHHHQEPFVRKEAKVGRNDPCPCGSQVKYKKCHGQGL